MNNQQIEDWIDANKQLMFVDENHAEHVIPIDKFRKLLKTHAIVPRESTHKIRYAMVLQCDKENLEGGISSAALGRIYKAMIESSENTPELSQSESNRK